MPHWSPFRKFLTYSSILIGVVAPALAYGATLVVAQDGHGTAGHCDAGKPTPYTKISSAIAAAKPNDVIDVCPGVYDEQLLIDKPLTLHGENGAVLQPSSVQFNTSSPASGTPLVALVLVQDTKGVTIQTLVVDGSVAVAVALPPDTTLDDNGCPSPGDRLFGIFFRNASGAVRSTAIENMHFSFEADGIHTCPDGAGIRVQTGNGASARVTIQGNSIHDYQRNGVTVIGAGVDVQVSANVVTGLDSAATAVQNGIQVSFGATGTVSENVVAGHVSPACVSVESCPATSTDVVIAQSNGVKVLGNTLGRSQAGVLMDTATRCEIRGNAISQTLVFDGIAVFADGNQIVGNVIVDSDESGIYVAGNANTIDANTINDAPIGIWIDSGTGNRVRFNRFINTPVTIQQ